MGGRREGGGGRKRGQYGLKMFIMAYLQFRHVSSGIYRRWNFLVTYLKTEILQWHIPK